MSTIPNPNYANATGNAQFSSYSHSATNSLTSAQISALVNGGVASAIANANATFIADPTFTRLFTETSGTGQSGTSYFVESQSQTQVVATFEIGANQTFSFDFNADIDLEAKEIETATEANEASSKVSFIVLDTSNLLQPEIIDYFGISGELISGEFIADVESSSSSNVDFTSNQFIDIDGDNGVDSIDVNAFNGTYERSFNTSKNLTLVKVNSSQIELFGDPPVVENQNLTGDNNNNVLEAGAGNDTLNGGFGNDTLRGQAGNDFLDGDYGFDLIDGGTGNDTVSYQFYYGSINANLKNGVVSFPGNSNLTDTLVGVENVIGADGHDDIIGNSADNIIKGGEGCDWLYGDDGNDSLYGGYHSDRLSGDSGDDHLYGDSGYDVLIGGTGSDQMSGGSGSDRFVFEQGKSFLSGEVDRISDFQVGIDWIEFKHFNNFSSFNQLVSQGYITSSGSNTLIQLNTGGQLVIEGVSLNQLHWSDFIFK